MLFCHATMYIGKTMGSRVDYSRSGVTRFVKGPPARLGEHLRAPFARTPAMAAWRATRACGAPSRASASLPWLPFDRRQWHCRWKACSSRTPTQQQTPRASLKLPHPPAKVLVFGPVPLLAGQDLRRGCAPGSQSHGLSGPSPSSSKLSSAVYTQDWTLRMRLPSVRGNYTALAFW